MRSILYQRYTLGIISLTKKDLDNLKSIPGFPIGSDEDIITLSDPPHYTACPNPWIVDFVKEHGHSYDPKIDNYQREPFIYDISEGKNDPIYNAQSYHTKVPPKAIMKYILHFTNPGDIVYDGFCGTGMTGVAASMCGNSELFNEITHSDTKYKKGLRKSILCDISPLATFISYALNNPPEINEFEKNARELISEIEKEFGVFYETQHTVNGIPQWTTDINGRKKPIIGMIDYVIWSEIFLCPICNGDISFWEDCIDRNENKVKEKFECPHCKGMIFKKKCERVMETISDANGKIIKQSKRKPVRINYSVKERKIKTKYIKIPDEFDKKKMNEIEKFKITTWYPTNSIPKGDKTSDPFSVGISNVYQFYTKRNLILISNIYERINRLNVSKKIRMHILLILTGFIQRNGCLANRFVINNHNPQGRINGPFSGTLYIPPLIVEQSILNLFNEKLNDVLKEVENNDSENISIIQTSSSSQILLSDNSIDYIFTDPPFGSNLMYSELNFLTESWLRVFTNNKKEAIMNKSQKKGLVEYQELMEQCFKENYRILKYGRWMTIEFNNSKNSVWKAIQEAIERSGFIVATVHDLDKIHGGMKSMMYDTATKQDLIISAYKPSKGLEKFFGGLSAGTEEGVWKFIDNHLKQLPIFFEEVETLKVITERQNYLLFDRMTAFHVQKGLTFPLSAAEFSKKLSQKYPERDDMYFLADQIPEYDQKRAQVKSIEQTTIFVEDEKSTILWLNEQLKTPQIYQEIMPKFLKEIHQNKFEKLPELSEILEQNFLEDDKNKWHVPDPSKLKDLEQLREKSLLREFQIYQESKGKLKQFRLEAIRAGFKKKWSENNYQSIVDIANKLPEEIIQEDSSLLMYYDNSLSRI